MSGPGLIPVACYPRLNMCNDPQGAGTKLPAISNHYGGGGGGGGEKGEETLIERKWSKVFNFITFRRELFFPFRRKLCRLNS